jgi:S1/P1 Nuclease
MKHNLRAVASALVLVLALGVPSYAWSGPGHMAVAYVAYQNLTPQVRSRVDELIRLNPKFDQWNQTIPGSTSAAKRRLMLFMIASTWADQIKSDGEHEADGTHGGNRPPTDGTAANNTGYTDTAMHKYWHFIDLPFSKDGTPLQDPPVPNAETQIAAFREVLASDSPDLLKSYDLVWLLHLVGDVHQPLHCTARFTHSKPNGDDGGNGVKVCSPGCDSLHSFWDGLFGTTRNPSPAILVGKSLSPAPASLAGNLDASEWIQESFRAAKSAVYKNPPIKAGLGPFTITDKYRNAAVLLGRDRIALAGARMANILNNELR